MACLKRPSDPLQVWPTIYHPTTSMSNLFFGKNMINVFPFIKNSLLGFGIDIQRASTSTFELKKVGSSVGGGGISGD
jgi:hypothetical protein